MQNTYSQPAKALSMLLLTSILLQSCGTNLMLEEQRSQMRENNEEAQPAALAASQPKSFPAETKPEHREVLHTASSQVQHPPSTAAKTPYSQAHPAYTPSKAWEAYDQRARKARGLPLAPFQGGLPGGAGSEDEGAREEKQSETLLTETQPVRIRALQHFRGEDPAGRDQRLSENWYDEETMQHLASTLAQRHALTVVFYDENPTHPNTSFVAQVRQLKLLTSQRGKKAALFVSKAPGTPHFLFGLMYENNLLILSPEGTQSSPALYAALAKLKAQGLAEEVFLSSTRLQEEASPASCGPICAELLLHYGAMEEEALEESIGLLYSLAQAREAHGVPYQEVDLTDLLPDTLRALVSEEGSQGHIDALRHHHFERLEAASSKLPEQALFMQLTLEGKRLQENEAPEGVVTFEGKRIATSYWYEDREMSSLLQAALKRYSREVSADRTCYTQADGSTITILGPLDNLSPQGLSEALLAYQRQPGLVLIPFNLGVLHWVGLLLAYAPSGRLVRAEYYDSLQRDVPSYLSDALRVHSLGRDDESLREFTKVQAPRLVTQANNSDCGPCTLENLLAHAGLGYTPEADSVRRRYQHLQWLEEAIQDARDQRYYDDFYRRQQRNEASFKVSTPTEGILGPSTRELQGPSKAKEAHQEMARRREKIEGEYAQLLSLASTTVNLTLVEALLVDLQWLLEKEEVFTPQEGEASAQAYLLRLKADASLPWTKEQYEIIIELLDKAYGQELKRVTGAASHLLVPAHRVARLLAVLESLAALHKERGDRTGDLAHYTDAATLYQHVLTVCDKEQAHLEEATRQAQEGATYAHLTQIKGAMLASVQGREVEVSPAALCSEIEQDKQALKAWRAAIQVEVERLTEAETQGEDEAYIKGTRALFEEIAKEMRRRLAALYEETEALMGRPAPCSYAVMGLGSMALSQMTPHSDLEFCLLIEESPNKEALQARRDYLRQLTHLVNLRVINLGESVMRTSDYGVNFDPIGKRGLNLDLGGKTPLGRKDKYYDLIQPVEGMLRYLRNEGEKASHMDKNLPFILEQTCYVHGNEALYKAYEEGKRAFLMSSPKEGSLPPHKTRALKKLLEGVVELDYSSIGASAPGRRLIGNLAAFAPKLEQDQEGRLFDVKQEIYRLPDRLLYELASYYGVEAASAWDGVAKLSERGILSAEGAQHLQYAASFATILRLRTYLHHGWQKEAMAVLESNEGVEAVQRAFRLPSEALQSGGSFFKYYYTALPLHEKMEAFFKQAGLRQELLALCGDNEALLQVVRSLLSEASESSQEEAHFFESEHFFESGLRVDAAIYERLMQPSAAVGCYEVLIKEAREKEVVDQRDLVSFLSHAGSAYEALGETRKALTFKEEALEMCRQLCKRQSHPILANLLNDVGSFCMALGELHKGLVFLEESLQMSRELYGRQAHPTLALSLNSVGIVYEALGDARKGLSFKEQALEMFRTLFQGQNHPDLARTLNNVGVSYEKLSDFCKALQYKEKALEMYRALYEGQVHPHLASSLNNVGVAYEALGETRKALAFLEQALEMRRTLFQGQAHPRLADSLNNVGSAYKDLGEPHKCLAFKEEALGMYRTLFAGRPHPRLADSLNNVGGAYHELGSLRKGLQYFEEALEMFRELFAGQPHPSIAATLDSVGVAYQALGDLRQGIRYQEEALEMLRTLFQGQAHCDLASALNNVGIAYEALGETRKGLAFQEEALVMRRALYEGQDHPDLARSLNNVGSAYQALGEPRNGLVFLKEALGMFRTLFPGQAHPALASSLNNVGSAYQALGEPRKGLAFQEEALVMRRALFQGQAHPDMASSLNNVGSAYQALGEPRKGLAFKEEALVMGRALFQGQAHPDTALYLNSVGNAYEALGEPRKGLAFQEEALVMFRALFAGRPHPHLAKVISNVGLSYARLGQMQQALTYLREGRSMLQALQLEPEQVERLNQVIGMLEMEEQNGLGERLQQAIAQLTSAAQLVAMQLAQHQQAAQEAYRNQDVAGAIRHYEEALQALPAEQEESSSGLYHNLGCMHHVAALNTEEEGAAQTHLDSAAVAFEAAVAAGEGVRAGLYAEYANFLLATAQLEAAQHYLSQAVESGDTAGGLGYSTLEQGTVHEALQGRIEQGGEVTVRGIDYAYFLLIHNYDTFVQAGITLERTQTDYLLTFKTSIEQNAGEAGKEKEDEMAYYLLGTLQQALGNEEAAQEAFILSQAIALARAA